MFSSEEEELFLLGFISLDDKRKKKKKTKKRRFWVREIFRQRERLGIFSNLLRELQLGDREYYFKQVSF